MKNNMTIIMVRHNSNYHDIDYKEKYNVYENDIRIQIWYNESDLLDLVNIAMNQIVRCNRIIIEK